MVEERRYEVLRAIVEDYVATEEPVGSKALAERHHLGVSPATIRNDMASLEEGGYITQPHTSAGRVPTDKGYRLFVDRLASIKPLSPPERRAIESFLEGAVDLDDTIGRTVRLLAQLTHNVAVVQYPSFVRSTLRHVELVSLTSTRVMFVLITDTGRVEQRSVEMPEICSERLLAELRSHINLNCAGSRLSDVPAQLSTIVSKFELDDVAVVQAAIFTLTEMSAEQNEERIVLAGTSNLAKFGGDFTVSVRPVLEALEEQVVLLRLLGEAAESVTVKIGHEHHDFGLHSTSLIAAGYGRAGDPLANLGILGPTRMDYPGSIAAVRAVAAYVGAFLTDNA
jgi:heat-inducible transcriptional repressor